jgi:23S rRNA pseudouridine1911/1915/1917 synthase
VKQKSPWLRLVVEQDEPSQRIDVWLASRVPGLSRRQAQKMMADGSITQDERPVKKGDLARPGSEIVVWSVPKPAIWNVRPDPQVPLKIAHEDAHLIAVSKISGISSVPLQPDETGTLANGVVARFPECAVVGRSPGDGGLMHRLDRETSGLLLAARSQRVHEQLWASQQKKRVEKEYLALVPISKSPLPSSIEAPLAHSDAASVKVVPAEEGHPCTTRVRYLSAHGSWQLVQARIHLGFRHQVRAHLASAGFPIAGDLLYGAGSPQGLERLFLHASGISFEHPVTREKIHLSSGLPIDLNSVIENL